VSCGGGVASSCGGLLRLVQPARIGAAVEGLANSQLDFPAPRLRFGLTVEQMLGDEDYIPANTPLSERLERLEIGIAELHDKLDLVLAAVTAVGEADGDEAVLQDERQERRERLLAADEEPLPEPEIGHRAGVASESEREAG
jgi:hypothetical protein